MKNFIQKPPQLYNQFSDDDSKQLTNFSFTKIY